MIAVIERPARRLTEPGHEQAHGGPEIAAIEQGGDDAGKRRRCLKSLNMLAPKREIGRLTGGFALPPTAERFRDVLGG
jgi:hypothetical protein